MIKVLKDHEIPALRSATGRTFETPKTKWRFVIYPSGDFNRYPYGQLATEFHCKRINFVGTDNKWHKMEEVMDFGRTWWQLKEPLGENKILPVEFVFKNIANGVRVYLPKYVGNRVPMFVNVDNITVYPDPNVEVNTVDGYVMEVDRDLTWANIIIGAGNDASDTSTQNYDCEIKASATTNQWGRLYRAIYLFDISSLSGSTASLATFSVYGQFKADGLSITPNVNVYSSAPATNTAVVAGDFDSLGASAYCDTPITYDGYSTAGYNAFAFNANPGLVAVQTAIDGTGIVKLGTRNVSYDVGATPPNWTTGALTYIRSQSAEIANTTSDPKLYVEYTAAGGGGLKGFMQLMGCGQ